MDDKTLNEKSIATQEAPIEEVTAGETTPKTLADSTVETTPNQSAETATETTVEASAEPSPASKDAPTPVKVDYENVTFGLGINLIPTMSEEEVQVEETKTKLNLSSLYIVLFFIVLTITVFGINIGYKLTLNAQRATNQELRAELVEKAYLVNTNNQTLDRLTFLKKLDSQSYSPKLVLNYFVDTFSKYGDINSVELTNQLDFTIVGTASSYKDSALLWHKLTTDPNIKQITIRAVSRSTAGDVVYVTFDGQLNSQNFLKGIIE